MQNSQPEHSVADQIEQQLNEKFKPTSLMVIDESHLHAGHASAPAGGSSHFRIQISASSFVGMSRVDRERAVTGTLSHLIGSPIHALVVNFV